MFKKIFLAITLFFSIISCNQVYGNHDLSSPDFSVTLKDFVPIARDNISGSDMKTKANSFFGTVINVLIVGIGSIALLTMSIGAGFIIFYNGQEDLLNKGKSLFTSGIIGLFLALSSYYIIELVKYIVYR